MTALGKELAALSPRERATALRKERELAKRPPATVDLTAVLVASLKQAHAAHGAVEVPPPFVGTCPAPRNDR